jgi:hypothetical protein
MIKFLQKDGTKNANIFAKFFGENILKIITSVPGESYEDAQLLFSLSKLIPFSAEW